MGKLDGEIWNGNIYYHQTSAIKGLSADMDPYFFAMVESGG